ncbi:antibiotic biosynthesis monooxygenase [Paenibacillus sonchi]|uniref:Antibiotic biosynthesis monooxygenase n=1 Tax=Paenibacillus sonchi TaxID=373687 RepID=A0A974P7R0_9BACL|nr:putative quinol monooxygenase [Paenibacillus sonchi]QQZ58979.1 antibiotic biosynthesis monooxygenase [Paenibacillus sonchi]
MTVITICAILKAKSGKEEQLLGELLKLIEPSRAEKGCIQYKLHQSIEEKGTFVFYEIWADEYAINEHVNTEHYITYRKNIETIIDTMNVYRLHNLES